MSERYRYVTRRDLAKGIGATGIAALAGCTGGTGGNGDNTTTATTTTSEPLSVAMVYTVAGKGDEGFNDSAAEGLQRAKEDLGIQLTEAEPEGPEQYTTFLRRFAQQDHDLVCGLSFAMATPMKKVAADFPDQQFTIVDVVVNQPNVASYRFKEHEGCYLVGQLNGVLTGMDFSAGAGSTNSVDVVGFIGGKKIPVIERFHAGYKAGVEAFDRDIEFRSTYAGTWTSPSKGKSIAESMYNEGADIVFPAAGGTGLGAFQAAQEQGRFAVGVDKKQSEATPKYADVILGSMIKKVGEAFYRSIENTIKGNHRGGEKAVLGLEREGVNLVYGSQLGEKIPQSVKDEVNSAREAIINGEIDVPKTLG